MATKLTANQEKVLSELRNGAEAIYMPYMGSFNPNAYWYLTSDHRRVTREMKKLLDLGLVKITKPRRAVAA